MHYRTSVSEEVVGPFHIRLRQLSSFEEAVDEMHAQLTERGEPELLEPLCPYFGVLWPGSRALARWIWEQGASAFDGKSVLELGCGLALPSFVAARLGARVVASDSHPHVPSFLSGNLALNPGVRIAYRHVDWYRGELTSTFDWIVASDVLYERDQAMTLLAFLRRTLSARGRAVILDPDRSFWRSALDAAARVGLRARAEALPAQGKAEPAKIVLIHLML